MEFVVKFLMLEYVMTSYSTAKDINAEKVEKELSWFESHRYCKERTRILATDVMISHNINITDSVWIQAQDIWNQQEGSFEYNQFRLTVNITEGSLPAICNSNGLREWYNSKHECEGNDGDILERKSLDEILSINKLLPTNMFTYIADDDTGILANNGTNEHFLIKCLAIGSGGIYADNCSANHTFFCVKDQSKMKVEISARRLKEYRATIPTTHKSVSTTIQGPKGMRKDILYLLVALAVAVSIIALMITGSICVSRRNKASHKKKRKGKVIMMEAYSDVVDSIAKTEYCQDTIYSTPEDAINLRVDVDVQTEEGKYDLVANPDTCSEGGQTLLKPACSENNRQDRNEPGAKKEKSPQLFRERLQRKAINVLEQTSSSTSDSLSNGHMGRKAKYNVEESYDRVQIDQSSASSTSNGVVKFHRNADQGEYNYDRVEIS